MDKNGVMEFAGPFIRSLAGRGAFLCVKGNVMTIGWAQVGWMWNKPILTVLVRPSRFSYGIIEENPDFTVCVPFEGKMREQLAYAGKISGRDENKLENGGIESARAKWVDAPVIEGCEAYAECKTLYKRDMTAEFMNESVIRIGYPKGDFHRMYFGEIIGCYRAGE